MKNNILSVLAVLAVLGFTASAAEAHTLNNNNPGSKKTVGPVHNVNHAAPGHQQFANNHRGYYYNNRAWVAIPGFDFEFNF